MLSLIKKISNVEVRQDPWECLFHATSDSRKKYRVALTPFLLNAAKTLIPKYCNVKKMPTMKEWLREVDRTRLMEELIHLQNDGGPRFYRT